MQYLQTFSNARVVCFMAVKVSLLNLPPSPGRFSQKSNQLQKFSRNVYCTLSLLISNPRRGCFMGLSTFNFFFFFFFFPRHFCPGHISGTVTRRLQIECAAWSCCLILHYSLPSNSLRYFFNYFLFFRPKFCPGHISGTVTRRLQIECAAWSCSLILHYCLPSNSLRYFFFPTTILSGPYLRNRYSQRLQIECAAWSCGLILHYCLPSNSFC